MIRRTIKHRRNRRQSDPSMRGDPATITPVASTPSGSTAVLTFPVAMASGPIPLAGDATACKCGTETLLSMVTTDNQVFTLTFSGAVSTNPVVIPSNCPTWRSYQGGYATAGSYPTA